MLAEGGAPEETVVAYLDGIVNTVLVKDVLAREIAPLAAITDNYSKIILTEEPGSSNDNGIEIINVADWLIEPAR